MRMLLLGAALLLAVPSAAMADDTTSGITDYGAAVTDTSGDSQNANSSQDGGVARNGNTCVQGFQTATCGDFTGCAKPSWQCCPNSSNTGWQWAEASSGCPL
jgi:hypothetical protein